MSRFARYPTYNEQKEATARSKWGNFTLFEHRISDNQHLSHFTRGCLLTFLPFYLLFKFTHLSINFGNF